MDALTVVLIILLVWFFSSSCSEAFVENAKGKRDKTNAVNNAIKDAVLYTQSPEHKCRFDGNVWTSDGRCLTRQQCFNNHNRHPDGNYYVWTPEGSCITRTQCSDSGNVWNYDGECLPPKQHCLDNNNYWTGTNCISMAQHCKDQGMLLSQGTCVPLAPVQQACTAEGKVWTADARCISREQQSCEANPSTIWLQNKCVSLSYDR